MRCFSHTVPCSFSPLIFGIYSSSPSNWIRTDSSKGFDTQVPQVFTEALLLLRYTRRVFPRLYYNRYDIPLSAYLSRDENLIMSPVKSTLRTPLFSICPTYHGLCALLWFGLKGVAWIMDFHGLPHTPTEEKIAVKKTIATLKKPFLKGTASNLHLHRRLNKQSYRI